MQLASPCLRSEVQLAEALGLGKHPLTGLAGAAKGPASRTLRPRSGWERGSGVLRPSASGNMAADLAQIPDVDIDSDGVFKYVLIRVHLASPSEDSTKECKEIVRGYKWAEYHGEGVAFAPVGWNEG